MKITRIFTSTLKLGIGKCDENAVIAETESGKSYCLFHMGTIHGFKKIADGYKNDIRKEIENFK